VPKQLQLGVLTGRTPYPQGLAATERIHLVARAMAEAGAKVRVWVDGLDRPPNIRNRQVAGERDGIAFEYLLGKTRESTHLLRLMFDRFAMAWAARRRMDGAARGGALDGLYFYTSAVKLDFERFVVRAQARKHGFPVVLDLCEAPWTLRPGSRLMERRISPLWGVNGVVCISRFLEDWVRQENRRTGREVRQLSVPILVDVNEFTPAEAPPRGKTVLFAGSPAYGETLRYLLAAMEVVWQRHADCSLVITGGATAATLGALAKRDGGRIRYAGYLERRALLEEYSASSVLAVPLFDDVRSHARFPTKIAEYLASGRPVVTNRVGEIPRFLEDGVSAQVPPPGDAAAFAAGISRLLDDPAEGQAMGRRGRQVAERHFHYANYGAKLCEFFSSLAGTTP
jgi:glycosyltransferase involved in cell wall biosynthesis